MKKFLVILLAIGFLIFAAGTASATSLTFSFDADDFIGLYSTSPLPVSKDGNGKYLKYEQDNPRRVHESWGGVMHNTFGTDTTETDQESQDSYIAWRNSLDTSHEGIRDFNIFLKGGTNEWNWGDRLVLNPDVMPTATAPSGWNWYVYDTNNWMDQVVEWWTTDENNRINLVNDHDQFSFTVDVREISAAGQTYADGTDIALGTDWDIWFGGYVSSDEYSWTDWEGTLELPAAPVPEPSTILLVGTGLLGIMGFGRKRLNKKA